MAVFQSNVPFADDDSSKAARVAMANMMGPQAVDQLIRQAISTCWLLLPAEKKNVATLETEIRRILDRAITNLKEDCTAFETESQS